MESAGRGAAGASVEEARHALGHVLDLGIRQIGVHRQREYLVGRLLRLRQSAAASPNASRQAGWRWIGYRIVDAGLDLVVGEVALERFANGSADDVLVVHVRAARIDERRRRRGRRRCSM